MELRREVSRAAAIARGKTLRRTPSEAILSRVCVRIIPLVFDDWAHRDALGHNIATVAV